MEHEQFTPQEISRFKVTFKYRKRSGYRPDDHPGGYAYYNSHTFVIKPVKGIMPDKAALATVIAHELAHCQGTRHRQMHNSMYGWVIGWEQYWAWANKIPLTMHNNTPAKLTQIEKFSIKLQHCESMAAKWKRQVRLAKTKEAHWKAKVRYYEKKSAAMTQPTEPTTAVQVSVSTPADVRLNPENEK
jgi:predicted SprT family Zn-dependent metalloprotease